MDSLIIYKSIHMGNTKKVAEAVSDVIGCEIKEPNEVENLDKYNLIGFASGVYYGDFHRSIKDFVDNTDGDGKRAFLLSTSGFRPLPFVHNYEEKMRKRLKENGFEFLGSFTCRGSDRYGPLKFFGGLHMSRPNESDLDNAKKFAEEMKKYVR